MAARIKDIDAGACIAGEAVYLAGVMNHRSRAGASHHHQVDVVITEEEAGDQHLLAQQNLKVARLHARIGLAQRVIDVLLVHFHQAAGKAQRVGGLHIALHNYAVGLK